MIKILLAVATMIGTIIGAGVFAVPYVFAQSGIITCLIYFVLVGVVAVLLHLFFGEIVLRTRGEKRLVGYANQYLNKQAKQIVSAALIIGTVGSLLVYLILLGQFLCLIFPNSFSEIQFSVMAWMILSLLVLFGANSVALANFALSFVLIVVAGVILFFCWPKFDFVNLSIFNGSKIFLPFGIFLFSMVGWSAISEAEDLLTKKKHLKPVIWGSVVFCALFYILFGFIVAGVSGDNTTPEAFLGLASYLGKEIMVLAGIFGFLAVATSFLTLSNYLRNTFVFDFKIAKIPAFLIVCFVPLLLFVAGLRQFIGLVSVLGVFIGLIEGVAIVLIWRKAKKHGNRVPEFSITLPRVVPYLVIFVLVGGCIVQLFGLK